MATRTKGDNQEGQAMGQLQSQVKAATLLKYVITYLEDELEEPREAFDANDGLDIHTLVNDAIDAYNGGAR